MNVRLDTLADAFGAFLHARRTADLEARGLGTSTGLLLVAPPALLAEAKVGRWRSERQSAGQYL